MVVIDSAIQLTEEEMQEDHTADLVCGPPPDPWGDLTFGTCE